MLSVCLCLPRRQLLNDRTNLYETSYIVASELISTAYFINPSPQSVCLRIPIVASQRFGKHVPAATKNFGGVVSYAIRVISKASLWVCVSPYRY
jgi:hypothetical protein